MYVQIIHAKKISNYNKKSWHWKWYSHVGKWIWVQLGQNNIKMGMSNTSDHFVQLLNGLLLAKVSKVLLDLFPGQPF